MSKEYKYVNISGDAGTVDAALTRVAAALAVDGWELAFPFNAEEWKFIFHRERRAP